MELYIQYVKLHVADIVQYINVWTFKVSGNVNYTVGYSFTEKWEGLYTDSLCPTVYLLYSNLN